MRTASTSSRASAAHDSRAKLNTQGKAAGTASLITGVTAVLFWSLPALAQAPPVVKSTTVVPCTGCSLVIERMGTIGASDAEGAYLRRFPRHVSRDARGRIIVSAGGPPQVFDSTGKYLHTIGRTGQGPLEFGLPQGVHRGPGDSLHVVESSRITVLTPAGDFVRSVSVPHSAIVKHVLDDGSYIAAGIANYRERDDGTPFLHSITGSGHNRASFGPRLTTGDGGRLVYPNLMIGRADARSFWVTHLFRYRLELYQSQGTLLRVIERSAPFMSGESRGLSVERLGPILTETRQDDHGRLWVMISLPPPAWKENDAMGTRLLYHTMVEVLNPADGSLIASARVPSLITWIMDDGYLAGISEGDDGEPLVSLWRARLVQPRR
jgi:hypothetical protein